MPADYRVSNWTTRKICFSGLARPQLPGSGTRLKGLLGRAELLLGQAARQRSPANKWTPRGSFPALISAGGKVDRITGWREGLHRNRNVLFPVNGS